MTHGRKPRKPRVINANVLGTVICRATLLQEHEVQDTLEPTHHCLARLREGVATEDEHTIMATVMRVSQGIEDSRIVRGLREHFNAAQQALDAIRTRALATGTWRQTPLYFHELDALREAVELHEFQLRQVTSGELQAITRKLIAQHQSSGGRVVRTDMTQPRLVAA